MKIVESEHNGTPVLALKGRIIDWEQAGLLRGKIVEAIQAGKKGIVLDLKDVDWINSVGLGLLVSILSTVKNGDARLKLANIENIEKLMTVTKLVTIFEISESVDEAVASLN